MLAVLREIENGVSVFVIEVVKEDTAAATALVVSVLDHKVVVTPLLELGPVLWIMLLTDCLQAAAGIKRDQLSNLHKVVHNRR